MPTHETVTVDGIAYHPRRLKLREVHEVTALVEAKQQTHADLKVLAYALNQTEDQVAEMDAIHAMHLLQHIYGNFTQVLQRGSASNAPSSLPPAP